MKIEKVILGGYRITNPPNLGMCWGAALVAGVFLARCQRQFKIDPLIDVIAEVKLTHPRN